MHNFLNRFRSRFARAETAVLSKPEWLPGRLFGDSQEHPICVNGMLL
jgi:hypothetical protein